MRTFYEEWSEYVNRQPAVDELPIDETELLIQIRQPLGDELNWADFLRVPFTHHVIILRKVKDSKVRAFYNSHAHMTASDEKMCPKPLLFANKFVYVEKMLYLCSGN